MTNANAEIVSSPSRNTTSSRSQAGNQQYKREFIKGDLEADINNSTKCGFDALLKYFISLVLEKGSEEKKRLDEIQTQIEKLQSERYYGNVEGNVNSATSGNDVEAAGTNGTEAATGRRQEDEGGEDKDDDTWFGSEEEKRLVKERDGILDTLLCEALKTVLPIANTEDVKKLLKAFAAEFPKLETKRYKPYVLLCNDVLKCLVSVPTTLPVREPDPLDIRFHRSDPKPVKSHFQDVRTDVERNPDVVVTSRVAALRASGLEQEDEGAKQKFSEKPKNNFEWPTILSCDEFKASKPPRIPDEGKVHKLDQRFKIEDPPQILPHADLLTVDVDVPETEANAPVAAEGSSSKRGRDGEYVEPENPSPSKRPRPLPGTPSGSNVNSANNSANNSPNPNFNARTSRAQGNIVEKKTQDAINGRVQCASYGLEMLSYSSGVHHAINLLFTDGHIWIWYYDRQGIVQSDGLSIFSNFPRFLVLLLAFQRFSLEDWGIIPCLNPQAIHGLGQQQPAQEGPSPNGQGEQPVPEIVLDLQEHLPGFWVHDDHNNNMAKVEVNMNEFLSHQPHCLAGRATSVVSAKGFAQDGSSVHTPMVCKIYHPELQRRHEGLTLQVVREIAKDNDEEMLNHLPTMFFYGDVPGCTTQRIRSMVKRKWKGHRALRILGLKKLEKITSVDGTQFIKAWLETVICHLFLWKNYVEHGDPSLSNIMYDPETQCGILSDFDLSLLQWESRVIGTDRTGTVPFMAIHLLTEDYWKGTVHRYFHHELESFIWILAYVVLLFEDGIRKPNSVVDAWRTSDYVACRKNKQDFYTQNVMTKAAARVQPSFKAHWPLVDELCSELYSGHGEHNRRLRRSSSSRIDVAFEASQALWNIFNTALELKLQVAQHQDFSRLLTRLKAQKPTFRAPDSALRDLLHKKYSAILNPDQAESVLGQ